MILSYSQFINIDRKIRLNLKKWSKEHGRVNNYHSRIFIKILTYTSSDISLICIHYSLRIKTAEFKTAHSNVSRVEWNKLTNWKTKRMTFKHIWWFAILDHYAPLECASSISLYSTRQNWMVLNGTAMFYRWYIRLYASAYLCSVVKSNCASFLGHSIEKQFEYCSFEISILIMCAL